MARSDILKDIEDHVKSVFERAETGDLVYHNLDHTRSVVSSTEQLAKEADLDREDWLAVMTAAWFHDVGYLRGYDNHEENSCKAASDYLSIKGVDPELVQKIEGCIQATKMPQNPTNKCEKILCDADLSSLGSSGYLERSTLLRKEWETVCDKSFSDKDWLKFELKFVGEHCYFTEAANKLFGKRKIENVSKLKAMQEEQKVQVDPTTAEEHSLPRCYFSLPEMVKV